MVYLGRTVESTHTFGASDNIKGKGLGIGGGFDYTIDKRINPGNFTTT